MYLIRAFPNVIILLTCNMYKIVSFSNHCDEQNINVFVHCTFGTNGAVFII